MLLGLLKESHQRLIFVINASLEEDIWLRFFRIVPRMIPKDIIELFLRVDWLEEITLANIELYMMLFGVAFGIFDRHRINICCHHTGAIQGTKNSYNASASPEFEQTCILDDW